MSEPTDGAPDGPRTPPWAAPAEPTTVGPTPTSAPPWVRPEGTGGFTGAGIPGPPMPATPEPRPAVARRPPKRSKLPIIGGIVVLLVVAGIIAVIVRGSSDSKGTTSADRSPEATVEAFSDAIASGDADTFCELLSASQRENLSRGLGGDCLDSVGSLLALAGALDVVDIDVTGSTIDGDQARVAVTVNGTAGEIPLVREDGSWVIDTSPDALVTGGPMSEGGGGDGGDGSPGSIGGESTSAACETELRTVQTAAEAYFAVNAEQPTSAQDLVAANMLRELPTRATVQADGTVVPAGDCA